jgi:hypothetical protein
MAWMTEVQADRARLKKEALGAFLDIPHFLNSLWTFLLLSCSNHHLISSEDTAFHVVFQAEGFTPLPPSFPLDL